MHAYAMSTITFFHICNDAFITEGTHSLNVIGIFDRIQAGQFPVLLPKFSTVCHIDALEGPHQVALKVRFGEQILAEVKSQFNGTNHQWISHFAGFTFPNPGEYLFEILIDGDIASTKRLNVIKQEM